ncbi:hypothetical protein EWM64_g1745 [Hericium alpestre]|uniref:Intradiol ring-cleavage dioxygenases domain-containing protein n=1 Tax=Hericium alpestre TaxID=135208 RepID=A0A4Z0A9P4_9AGAM|nr:hypothetical protein EWM64_g1745 [Hericium alpestre]
MSVPKRATDVPSWNGILPPSMKLPFIDTPDSVTYNAMKLAELTPDPRMREILVGLVRHMHDFTRETSITTDEWLKGIKFMAAFANQRQPPHIEYMLLLDVFGVSTLVDTINNPPVKNATASDVIGPFFMPDAPDKENKDTIVDDTNGIGKAEYLYFEGRILTTDGQPIPNVSVEVWEVDEEGLYDLQYESRDAPNGRGRFRSRADGTFEFRGVVPSAYPIPLSPPLESLMNAWNRHNMRAAHVHFWVKAPGFRELITQLYPDNNEWVTTDGVFGGKRSLVINLKRVDDKSESEKRGIPGARRSTMLSSTSCC